MWCGFHCGVGCGPALTRTSADILISARWQFAPETDRDHSVEALHLSDSDSDQGVQVEVLKWAIETSL